MPKKEIPAARAGKMPKPLALDDVYRVCETALFDFNTTEKIGPKHDIVSQDRAIKAINLGLSIRKPGYNIYVAGIPGTGKTSVIRSFLERWSADSATPPDWIYVYDFETPESPHAISMPAGEGRKFKRKVDNLIKLLREEIPLALQSEDYENAVNAYLSASNDRKGKLFSDLEKKAKGYEFQVKSTRLGIETIPIVDGRVLTEKEYTKLSDQQKDGIEERRSLIEPEVLDFARKVRSIEMETKEYVEKLRSELARQVISQHLDPLIDEYKGMAAIATFLEQMRKDILEHLSEFIEQDDARPSPASSEEGPSEHASASYGSPMEEPDHFRRYGVNVFVDHTHTKGAPVIIETNPTYYNLFGKIEKNVENGMYLTDFTMIKAGSVHRASGGYLVVNANDIFKTSSIWETLKRVLKNRLGFIEDMGEQYSLLPTSGLRPVPIPLDLKMIIIGSDEIYRTLLEFDEEFQKIFKVKADFDYKMPRDKTTIDAYVDFIATRSEVEKLLSFDKSGVAAVVEYGSRLVSDQRLLSTQFGQLKDVIIESDFIARGQGSKTIKREHVEKALEQSYYRVNLYEEHVFEGVENEDVLLTVDGEKIGQVNGLAVYDFGDFTFGKVGRITCTVHASSDGVFNVERASRLSGRLHDKGVHILTGFISSLLAREKAMSMAARVCFEQSYGMIDGDSATITEAVAIVSALAEIPVRQFVAMTGSLNQFGEVQPIGGVNEKIEGYFHTTKLIGDGSSPYSVLIPYQNVPHLMLKKEVRDAIEKKKFWIYPVRNFAEVFKLATGVELGAVDIYQKSFSEGSALSIVEKRLAKIALQKKKATAGDRGRGRS